VDHLPELVSFLSLVMIVGHRELRAEEEVSDRVFMKHSMDEDPVSVLFKVDAMVAAAVAVESAAVPADRAEIGPLKRIKVGGKDLELSEQVELEILRESAHLCGADGIEDDLEHGREGTVNKQISKSGKNHRDEGDARDWDPEGGSDYE